MTIFSRRAISMALSSPTPEQEARQEPDLGRSQDSYLGRCLEVLELWLRWDEENRQLTERLYQAGNDVAEIEQMLDELDVLRRTAAEASRAVLAIARKKAT